ncbi:hypothetical protein SAMN04488026_11102 [Aliiruegeria lutimaris]|uniref:Uncharacterized protein n=1 Tax=Aliiruegeria lutimaris TaxID=571298 RepID=A0A1G9MGJ4_9RHOB|nr:hypothetical protein SAMN04488026_11102 [Aliiruegeria lutimaris]
MGNKIDRRGGRYRCRQPSSIRSSSDLNEAVSKTYAAE